jgi:hypothetical protein
LNRLMDHSVRGAVPDPGTDLAGRWLPTSAQVAAGVAALDTVPPGERERFVAVVVLVQPGKTYGIWETGQPVVALPGVWLGENTQGEEPSLFPLRQAVAEAERVGEAWFAQRPPEGREGTVATAFVYPGGEAAVFESLRRLGSGKA